MPKRSPKPKPAGAKYDDARQPRAIAYPGWLCSMLSTARHYGGCSFNGAQYLIDMLTGELCREDEHRVRAEAYTAEDKEKIKANYADPKFLEWCKGVGE